MSDTMAYSNIQQHQHTATVTSSVATASDTLLATPETDFSRHGERESRKGYDNNTIVAIQGVLVLVASMINVYYV